MAPVNIDRFIETVGQGARPNQFIVNIDFPGVELDGGKTGKHSLLCKGASLPASTIGIAEVPFRGRTIKLSGDRTYATWSATFIADNDMGTRSRLEQWNNMMNNHKNNTAILDRPAGTGLTAPRGYAQDIYVMQIQKNSRIEGRTNKIYQLKYAFPTNIGSIELAYDNNNTVSEYTVDFEYSYFRSTDIEALRGTETAANTQDVAGELFRNARDIFEGDSDGLRLREALTDLLPALN